ncbi:IS66 family insertion sequence element accessory protein TnpB [Acinetobacter sp. FDAARGOS_559]|uniref:IS66 family insertion sequence element accessory protein TnpB n=1 Tax=Acinetobacter sp. FDAARGOS_559 TaxID=2420304 RepID=UPI000F684F59|nr:IS66 family insertion sequence element accessory protein TnpB [Acinetobacter sp. FDAARGOS_559]RSF52009.1 hypothetical protein EGS71_01380 [Acinetobacter sp. FDAARGOS_559]
MKVLVHDGTGIWLCARLWNRVNFTGLKFTKVKPWPQPEQLQALIQGLPWQRIGLQQVVNML